MHPYHPPGRGTGRQGAEGRRLVVTGLARHRLGCCPVSRNGSERAPPAYPGAPGPARLFNNSSCPHEAYIQKQGSMPMPFRAIWNDVKYMAYNHPNRLDPDLICKGMSVVMRFRNSRRFQKENQEIMKLLIDALIGLQSVAKPRHYAIAIYALTGVSDKVTYKIPEILAHFDDAEDEEVRKIPLDDLYNVLWALKDLRVRRVPKVLLHAVDHHAMNFSTRHLIAITWALANLKILPPKSVRLDYKI